MNTAKIIPLTAPRATARDANGAPLDPVHVRFERFELDEANARLFRDGEPVALARRPFALLCALVRNPGSLLTKNALLDEVWGHQFVSDSGLKTTMSDLRTVLDDDVRRPRFIETVSRRGYRFIAETTPVSPATVAACADQPGIAALAEMLPCLRAARDRSCNAMPKVACVRNADACSPVSGCEIPKPVYATSEEVRYAQELWLRVRARLLKPAESIGEHAMEPLLVGAR